MSPSCDRDFVGDIQSSEKNAVALRERPIVTYRSVDRLGCVASTSQGYGRDLIVDDSLRLTVA